MIPVIVVPFRVTIPPERQDPGLKDKLKEERAGILLWALEGLRRLKSRGTFSIPAICQEAVEDYRQESNPAKVFLMESCREAPGETTVAQELYASYKAWSAENSFDLLDARQFGKEVRKAFPKTERKRATTGRRPWFYRGLAYVSSSPMTSTSDEIS